MTDENETTDTPVEAADTPPAPAPRISSDPTQLDAIAVAAGKTIVLMDEVKQLRAESDILLLLWPMFTAWANAFATYHSSLVPDQEQMTPLDYELASTIEKETYDTLFTRSQALLNMLRIHGWNPVSSHPNVELNLQTQEMAND